MEGLAVLICHRLRLAQGCRHFLGLPVYLREMTMQGFRTIGGVPERAHYLLGAPVMTPYLNSIRVLLPWHNEPSFAMDGLRFLIHIKEFPTLIKQIFSAAARYETEPSKNAIGASQP